MTTDIFKIVNILRPTYPSISPTIRRRKLRQVQNLHFLKKMEWINFKSLHLLALVKKVSNKLRLNLNVNPR